ncbi:hypothetical protein KVR01_009142 [Diaporthe batatas]|uniref:uncharacterized protein n=1 Tax=Diaporthe batatas TaxID=748121 RepID=UPI001D03C5E2|nr:uncharacterized protein KVR01_009142 [Diaporthe batatas]KAG8160878.1 hypothetical protein KVR01_009142 [Diaporthe batatas]
MFLAGPLLAEASLTWPPHSIYDTIDEHGTAGGGDQDGRGQVKNSRVIHLLGHFTTISWFLLGCHLCSWPETLGAQTPGYRTLAARYTPAPYHGDETMTQLFWLSWGGVLVMMAVMYSPPLRRSSLDEPLLQRLFTNRFAAYLGEISYSMYLCHSSVNEIVGMRYMRPAWFAWMETNREAASLVHQNRTDAAATLMDAANTRFLTRWALGMFVNTLVLFWVSDLFNRAVDARSVRFTKKISEWARRRF